MTPRPWPRPTPLDRGDNDPCIIVALHPATFARAHLPANEADTDAKVSALMVKHNVRRVDVVEDPGIPEGEWRVR